MSLMDKVKELEQKIDTMKNQRADDLNLIEALEHAAQKSAERLLSLQSEYSNKVLEIANLKQQARIDLKQKLIMAQEDTERMNWLESFVNENGALLLHNGSVDAKGHSGLGLRPGYLDRTLREAIDAARGVSR